MSQKQNTNFWLMSVVQKCLCLLVLNNIMNNNNNYVINTLPDLNASDKMPGGNLGWLPFLAIIKMYQQFSKEELKTYSIKLVCPRIYHKDLKDTGPNLSQISGDSIFQIHDSLFNTLYTHQN